MFGSSKACQGASYCSPGKMSIASSFECFRLTIAGAPPPVLLAFSENIQTGRRLVSPKMETASKTRHCASGPAQRASPTTCQMLLSNLALAQVGH